uniref:Si:ch73-238c9.1 n=1 Tax=Seriola dumerili TaxID=41447 RepID=A0A3B4VES5_SERDU
MNIGSKNKKRVVLPSRPDPPTVDQILEDINRAAPNDPWFTVCLSCPCSDSSRSSDSDVDLKFQQCRQYLDLNERLQESRSRLLRQREELRAAGEQLDRDVAKCLSPRANRPWAEFLPSGRLT